MRPSQRPFPSQSAAVPLYLCTRILPVDALTPLIWTSVDGPFLHCDRSFDMTRPSACAVAATASTETPSRADINFDMTLKPPKPNTTSAPAKRQPKWVPVPLE